jgi:hypothetical protein
MSIAPDSVKRNAVELDKKSYSDLQEMVNTMPIIRTAGTAFLSMIITGPFSWSIPRLRYTSNDAARQFTAQYWVPWQRDVYYTLKILGVVPYYIAEANGYPYPVVPDLSLGTIWVSIKKTTHGKTASYGLDFEWQWHGERDPSPGFYWILSDRPPAANGAIRSQLQTLCKSFRTIRILRRNLEAASEQSGNLTHALETLPSHGGASNDHLTGLTANFGEMATGATLALKRKIESKVQQLKHEEAVSQQARSQFVQTKLRNADVVRASYSDSDADIDSRFDSGLSSRTFILPAFHRYVNLARPAIVADLMTYERQFDMDAAAAMDFAAELIQPTGGARSQNYKSSERYENERVKEAIAFFRQVTKEALINAFGDDFREFFDQKHVEAVSGSKGSDIVPLFPELDIEVHMSSTPLLSYEHYRNLWQDGVMSKRTFAEYVFQMSALPLEEIELFETPDGMPVPEEAAKKGPTKKEPAKKEPAKRERAKKDPAKKEGKKKAKPDESKTNESNISD